MRHQPVNGQGVPGMKAALAELLAQLRQAAVDGVVPEHDFTAQARALGLGDAERDRLREELARLGLPVQRAEVHTEADRADTQKVARIREENVLPRGEVVWALLRRYADSEGYVTFRAVDGVARLAGLGAREAAALRAGATVRRDVAATEADSEESEEVDIEPLSLPARAVELEAGDLAAAMAAALVVLEEDRFRRRPETYLLKAEAEVGLAVLVRGGADHIAEEPVDETLNCLPPGDIRIRARDCLVLHNQRLVHKLVPRDLDQGLDYEDLFQNGVLGLMRAARKFDPAKGFKFSTYATWWIRQSITRAIADEGALIRIPVHMHEQIRKVAAAERTLYAQGRSVRAADVAVFCDMSVEKVETARRLSRRTDSLDRVIGDGATLADFVGQTQPLPSVEHRVLDALLLEQAMAVVATFSERGARILVRRLGLDGDEPSTLDELGREFGVTRERIRQLEVKLRGELKGRLRAAGLIGVHGSGGGGRTKGERARVDTQPSGGEASAEAVVREAEQEREWQVHVPEVLPAPVPMEELLSATEEQVAASTEEAVTAREELGEHGAEAVPGSRTQPSASGADSPAGTLCASPDRAPNPPPERSPSVLAIHLGEPSPSAVPVQSPPLVTESVVPEPVQYTADWEKALRMSATFDGGIAWLAEYALLALGHPQLRVILGPPAAAAVLRAAREREMPDRPALTALEVLQRVFDILKEAGLRPEDFFERPAESLVGLTPRKYLAKKPLVHTESRLAVRDALREFVAEVPKRERTPEEPIVAQAQTHGTPAGPLGDRTAEPDGLADDARPPAPGPGVDGEGRDARGVTDGEGPSTSTTPVGEHPQDEQEESPEHPPGHGEVVTNEGTAPAGAEDLFSPDRAEDGAEQQPGRDDTPAEEQRASTGAGNRHSPAQAEDGTEQRPVPARGEDERQQVPAHREAEQHPFSARADVERQLAQLQADADERLAQQRAASAEELALLRAAVDQRLAEVRSEHEARMTGVRHEHHQRLTEERQAADARVAAAEADTERQLDTLEEMLLHRVDKTLLRQEQHLCRQAEERIARLREEHREAQQVTAQRAEHAAQGVLSAAAERAAWAQQRANEADQRLRRYREEGEARVAALEEQLRRHDEEAETRIAALEERLQRAEALLAERDHAVRAAHQQAAAQVEAAEQRTALRIAQAEHDAWARITELQEQLAAEREAADSRTSFRDRWRRS